MLSQKTDNVGGIYIHIPFCLKKCDYCDFYSTTDLSLKKTFINALLKEINLRSDRTSLFDTLYFGGGTPSILKAQELELLIRAVTDNYKLASDMEITVEANPGTITKDSLTAYRRIGVNRINIGVQSFQDDLLNLLGRIHNADQAISALTYAREAGFDNLGLDLIYGIPNQTMDKWLTDLKHALAFDPEHLSCYMLTFEKGTPHEKALQQKIILPLPDQHTTDMMTATLSCLTTHKYEHYEISNFAKSGRPAAKTGQPSIYRSRHNQKYWSFQPYSGFGPSAHSYIRNRRFWNHRQMNTYIAACDQNRLPVADRETLTSEQQLIEWIYLGLRKKEGISIETLENKFKLNFLERFGPAIRGLKQNGYLSVEKDACRLTRLGITFADSISRQIIELI